MQVPTMARARPEALIGPASVHPGSAAGGKKTGGRIQRRRSG